MQYQSNSRHTHWLIALAIFGIAFLLRLPTVWHALPYIPYSDETYVMDRIFYTIRANDPLLSDFLRPHFSINLFALAVRVNVWLSQIDPSTLPESTFRVTTLMSPFVAARLLNICFGAGTAVAVFLWARLIMALPLAIIAGSIMALIPFHIEYSGLLTPDVLAGMCATCFFWLATRYLQHPSRASLIGMIICTGCATGAKYNFISLALVMAWLIWRSHRQSVWRTVQQLVGAWLTVGVVFILTSPSIVFHFNDFVAGFININRLYYTASATDPTRFRHFPFDTYATWLGVVIIPTTIALSAIWGIISAVRYRNPILIGSIGVALLNLAFFFAQSAHAPRNFIFVEPIAVVVSLYGFTTLYKLPNIWQRRPEWALSWLLLGITAWSGIQATLFFARPYNPNVVDTYLQSASRGAPSLAHVEAVLYNTQPWIIPLTTEDVALFQTWQEAGANIIAINRKYWPDLTLQSADLLNHLGASDSGGSGWPYDIYKNHLLHNLRTIGTPLSGSDGVDFIGIRIGRGNLRPQLTPLEATTHISSAAEALQVNVYLNVNRTPTKVTPLLFVHVIDANGNKVGERNTVPVDYYAMDAWRPGDMIVANADVPTGALAAGNYQLVIGFYIVEQGQIVPFASPDGTARIDVTVTP